ncbi:hypothetical protein H0A36_01525 [Endozoicomonas sp. SM1973]|uniref:Uncharacterized protein n=1 Tax=Spartinivicinus marinus TaxID=2994442 RepID=A0A853I4Z2_9GAMM|nr:hypothetical protein [Spartinivicinus marinus]MCX4030088.1 hypothetical protein [Spartinivicinus marinus]NYZ64667.1 hypothetical protein [Spartinivicinus marinus]
MAKISTIVKAIGTCFIALQLLLQMTPATAQENVAAVVKPNGICTMDYNQCGNSSICSCPDGYKYDAAVGYCIITDKESATVAGVDKRGIRSACSIKASSVAACTRDINRFGNPSVCNCPGSTEYNEVLGHCVDSAR